MMHGTCNVKYIFITLTMKQTMKSSFMFLLSKYLVILEAEERENSDLSLSISI